MRTRRSTLRKPETGPRLATCKASAKPTAFLTFRDVFDKNLKRSQRTELVNKTVRKNKKGKLELVVQSPADLAVAVPSLRQELVSYASA